MRNPTETLSRSRHRIDLIKQHAELMEGSRAATARSWALLRRTHRLLEGSQRTPEVRSSGFATLITDALRREQDLAELSDR